MGRRPALLCIITFLLALLGNAKIAVAQSNPPIGWRFPTVAELADDWRGSEISRRAEAIGDFDGDGKTDRAVLLISIKNERLGVFVFLAGDRPAYWRRLDVINDRNAIHAMGLELVRPGEYLTACEKGYVSCRSDAPKKIQLGSDGIKYFKTESASRIFYFDKRAKWFRQAWMSD